MNRIFIGLDVGDRTMGVAISDPFGWTAQPVETWLFKGAHDEPSVFTKLRELMCTRECHDLVVGLPLHMNGSWSQQATKVEGFMNRFDNHCLKHIPDWDFEIHYRDERLSTAGAERHLISANVSRQKRDQVIDAMAAVFILQGFLDEQRLKNEFKNKFED